jgi:hypothetical protein
MSALSNVGATPPTAVLLRLSDEHCRTTPTHIAAAKAGVRPLPCASYCSATFSASGATP